MNMNITKARGRGISYVGEPVSQSGVSSGPDEEISEHPEQLKPSKLKRVSAEPIYGG